MTADLIRFVESISSDKQIERETVFTDLEAAIVSAAQRAFPNAEDVIVQIDRMNGDIGATVDGDPIDMKTLGRIAAQTAKQVMMQKIREDERSSIFEEYSELVGTVVTGTVARYEGASFRSDRTCNSPPESRTPHHLSVATFQREQCGSQSCRGRARSWPTY